MMNQIQSQIDNLPAIEQVPLPLVAKMVADIMAPKLEACNELNNKHDNQFNRIFDNNYLAVLTLTSSTDLLLSLEKLLTLKSGQLSGTGIILIAFTLPTNELASLVWPLARFGISIISSEKDDLAQHAMNLLSESEQRLVQSRARWQEQDKIINVS